MTQTAGERERELVIKAVHFIHQYRDKGEDEIIKRIIDSGEEDIDAEKAMLFAETAFARVMLSDSGARFSDIFTVQTPSSKSNVVQARFSLEPIYEAAISVAQEAISGNFGEIGETPLSKEEFVAASSLSWECKAVMSIQSRGESLRNYDLSQTAFFSMNDQVFEKWRHATAALTPSSRGPETLWMRLRRLFTA